MNRGHCLDLFCDTFLAINGLSMGGQSRPGLKLVCGGLEAEGGYHVGLCRRLRVDKAVRAEARRRW